MSRLQWSRFGMAWNVLLRVFCLLRAHGVEDVRGASLQGGLATAVMRNRSLRNRVVRR
jgi:hypothetical protein